MSLGWLEDDLDFDALEASSHPRVVVLSPSPRGRCGLRSSDVLVSGLDRVAVAATSTWADQSLSLTESDSDSMADDPQLGAAGHGRRRWASELSRVMGRRSRRSSRTSRPSRGPGESSHSAVPSGGLGSTTTSAQAPRESTGPADKRWRLTDVYKRLDDLVPCSLSSTLSSGRPGSGQGACFVGWAAARTAVGAAAGVVAGDVDHVTGADPEHRDDAGAASRHTRRLPELARSARASPAPATNALSAHAFTDSLLRELGRRSPPPSTTTAAFIGALAEGPQPRPHCPQLFRTPTSSSSSMASSGFLPDLTDANLAESRANRRADLGIGGLGMQDDALALARRSSRERLLRRHQLLGQRVERNRSLQEMHELRPATVLAAPSSSAACLSATRLPDIGRDREAVDRPAAERPGAQANLAATTTTGNDARVVAEAEASKARAADDFSAGGPGKDDQEAVLSMLECPVCRDFLQPPLKQCCNGHVVCFACWPRLSLSLCPACRAPFIPTASLALDGVLRALRFPCPNKEHGCGLYLKMDDRPAHDQVCPFRPRGCPMSRCEWQGLADALLPHCRAAHAPIALPVAPPALLPPGEEASASVAVPFVVDRGAAALDGVPTIVYHEQRLFSLASSTGSSPPDGDAPIFLFQSRYDLWRSKFFAEMVRVASQMQPNERYAWEVELRSPDGEVQLSMRSPVAWEASPASCSSSDPAAPVTPPALATPATPMSGLDRGLGFGRHARYPQAGSLTPSSTAHGYDYGHGHGQAGPTSSSASPLGLKLDLDVFNQFMEAGKYTLRIALHPLGAPVSTPSAASP